MAIQWATVIGRPDLAAEETFSKYRICSVHFPDHMYNRPGDRNSGSSLRHDAAPCILPPDSCRFETPSTAPKIFVDVSTTTYECRCTRGTQTSQNTERRDVHVHNRCMKLRLTVRQLRSKVARLQAALRMQRIRERRRGRGKECSKC